MALIFRRAGSNATCYHFLELRCVKWESIITKNLFWPIFWRIVFGLTKWETKEREIYFQIFVVLSEIVKLRTKLLYFFFCKFLFVLFNFVDIFNCKTKMLSLNNEIKFAIFSYFFLHIFNDFNYIVSLWLKILILLFDSLELILLSNLEIATKYPQ